MHVLPVWICRQRSGLRSAHLYLRHRRTGRSRCVRAGISFDKKVRDLSEDEINKVRTILEEEGAVEGDLRKEVSMNIKRHIEMGSYRDCGTAAACRCGAAHPYQRAHAQRTTPRNVANKKKAAAKT